MCMDDSNLRAAVIGAIVGGVITLVATAVLLMAVQTAALIC